jgi:hypothetical protein
MGQKTKVEVVFEQLKESNKVLSLLPKRFKWGSKQLPNPFELLEGKLGLFGDERVISILFSVLREKFGFKNLQISREALRNQEFWSVRYDTWQFPKAIRLLKQLVSAGVVDHFRYRSNQFIQEYMF